MATYEDTRYRFPGIKSSDNIVFDTASKGIYLGVTSATASNLLDDYEEGTWTPSISSGITSPTYTNQRGYYTKIGNTVHFNLQIITNGGTAAATRIKIDGLPFTSRAATDVGGGAYFIYTDADLVNSTTRNLPLIFIEPTTLEFYDSDGGFFTGTEASDVASLNFYLAGTYYTT